MRVLSLLTLIFVGCEFIKRSNSVEYIILSEVISLHYPERKAFVFKDAESFGDFWNKYCQAYDFKGNKLLPPKIDFSQNMLVAIFMGKCPTGGYAIKVTKIEEKKNKIKVFIKESGPPEDAIVPMVITYPGILLKLKKQNKPFEFIWLNKIIR